MTAPPRRPPSDGLGRPLSDLRVSVTDRCNFRCPYCMPREIYGEGFAFVERDELLTFEEIALVVRAAARLGVRKVRLTGGEPLLRRDIAVLVSLLRGVEGIEDLAMTTNGALLASHAADLARAGLDRVTVSLDAVTDATFGAMSDTPIPRSRVLKGLAAARDAGLGPIKVNAVVRRGINDGEVVDLARLGRDHGWTVRFIEYMDVGTTNGWRREDVVTADDIVALVGAAFPCDPVEDDVEEGDASAPASRFRYRDGRGEFGVIASVTRPFCRTCVRARLSPVGELFTCLFAARGHDLRALVRAGAGEDDLVDALAGIWGARTDRYSELRSAATAGLPKVEMSYIGG